MNRFLRLWGWWLCKFVLDNYEYGYTNLTYVPNLSKKLKQRKNILYRYPYLPKGIKTESIAEMKTTDLLEYLEDPDDAHFLNPGFIFFKEKKDNGLSVYEYYPLLSADQKIVSCKEQITEIIKAQIKKRDEYPKHENQGIGHGAALYMSRYEKNEDYADNMFVNYDSKTRIKLQLFKRQILDLQKSGVPLDVLDDILHEKDRLSKLVITPKHEILLPDYNNMEIKMEPLVKAVFFLFLKHPEGILFKTLPDYKKELIGIYQELKPMNAQSLQSIDDVTNPISNSINEKCSVLPLFELVG